MDFKNNDGHGHGKQFFEFFFLKPVPAIIWILIITLMGITGYHKMIKESLPDLEVPQFHITTIWEGATPEMVEKEVTQEIEKNLRGLKGVKQIYSSSMEGRSIVAVKFYANCKLTESTQLIQRQLGAVAADLPKSAESPKVEISSVNDLPIATIVLSGNTPQETREVLAKKIKQKLEQERGIKRVNILGAGKKTVRVMLFPERLKILGVSPCLVRDKIKSHGYDAPWGKFEAPHIGFSMKFDGAYNNLTALKKLVITRLPGGNLVRLDDVADIRIGYLRKKKRSALSINGSEYTPVIALDVLKASEQDTIMLIGTVEKIMEDYSNSPVWPRNISWQIIGNEAEAICSELERGFSNGWQSMLAVFLVLFILLTWREAFIAALAIPFTMLASLAVLWLIGYTFNMLVIVGMILALGLLVDDFILVMEGMHEGLFVEQLSFAEAVKRTIKNYAVPSFSGSITTILVFVPLVFLGGVDGKFISVIPVTAAICLIMSYVISIFVAPAASRFLLGSRNRNYSPGVIDRLSRKTEKKLSEWIGKNVVSSRKRAFLLVTAAFMLFLISLLVAGSMRNTLYSKEDGRSLGITVRLASDTTLRQTEKIAVRLGEILRRKKYLQHVIRVSGAVTSYSMSSYHDNMGRRQASNIIGFNCFLTPGTEREKLAHEYSELIRSEFEEVLKEEPGATVIMTPETGGPSGEDPVQIDICGDDMEKLRSIAADVKRKLASISGVMDIRDSIGPERLELRFRPMHEAMDHYCVSQEELTSQMVAYMENEKIAKYRCSGTQDNLDIRLEAKWFDPGNNFTAPTSWEELDQISIINAKGQAIPLWSLVEPEMVSAENRIFHNMGRRSVTVLAKLKGIYESEVIRYMRPEMERMRESWPPNYSYRFAGAEDVKNTYKNMFLAFGVSILLVYAILALLFDSLIYPGIILSTVFFALTGVFFGFVIGNIPLSFSASIGIVALVGIVVNDAIIMIETIRKHKKSGLSTFDAAKHGASDRLRPILSTTITNFAGLTPLALSDPGWAPLCQAIIFGEFTATIGAIILIPALYVLVTKNSQK